MSGFIDTDELKIAIVEEGQRSKRYKIGETWELNWREIEKVIDNVPTVDAVPVDELKNRDVKFYDKGKAFEVFFPIGLDLDTVNKVEIRGREFVSVVRCRDCKHFELAYYKKDGTENFKYKRGVCCRKKRGMWVPKDWFCADGERR